MFFLLDNSNNPGFSHKRWSALIMSGPVAAVFMVITLTKDTNGLLRICK